MSRLHLAIGPEPDEVYSVCGWLAVDLTTDRADVTCRLCQRWMRANPPRAPFVPGPPRPVRRGVTALTRTAERAIEQSVLGAERPGRGWPTAEAAVRYWVSVRDEGVSMGSTANPDRAIRVQTNRNPARGGREHLSIERARNVGLALDAAEALAAELERACPVLTAVQCREVYLLRVAGKLSVRRTGYEHAPRKGLFGERLGMPGARVVEHVRERLGKECGLTERHVSLIRRHFTKIVTARLTASGEMVGEPAEHEEARGAQWDPLARLREVE